MSLFMILLEMFCCLPFTLMLTLGLLSVAFAFILFRYVSLVSSIFRTFVMKGCGILLKVYFESIDYVIFPLESIYVILFLRFLNSILIS